MPAPTRMRVVLKTIVECNDSLFLALLMTVVYKSEMTTNPMPPVMNNTEAIRGTDVEEENMLKFSEKVEKPALQNADTAWKNAWPNAVSGLNIL